VDDDLPAAGVLQEGDQLVAVDGKDLTGLTGDALALKVREQVATHTCAGEPQDGCIAETPVELTVLRDGEEVTLEIKPEYEVPTAYEQEQGAEARMLIGFGYEPVVETVSIGEGVEFALDRTWLVTSETAKVFSRILEAEQREQITSVVGATEVTRQSFELETRKALGLLGVISLSLGLINLLPFLPLDGGHIFWTLVEKVRGRRVSLQTMERASFIGIALVLALFFIGLNNDISRITGEGFDVR
jgi:regulator of sigma E protease